ncbi:ABC transporter ATP-binding protein [Desertimonas flava]|uniref:dipeptide ABC transporter ATP-binding protein n=1 Tax=Desertimonas flava TaxID=2064846 RepID=UPI0013C3E9F3|nr:ABC transporter ATP-binding protein [Desertimonas flava]
MPDGHPLLDVDHLTVAFGSLRAVRDATFTIDRGERVGVVGESGSGKSTLAHSVMQLLPDAATIEEGTVRLDGSDLVTLGSGELRKLRGTRAGMVFQDPLTSFDPLRTIGSHLKAGLRAHGLRKRALIEQRSQQALRDAGLPDPESQLRRYPHELSGGMRQRGLIALGLENGPTLLVADEPTTALDVTIQAQIAELFATIGEPGPRADMALLIVSHNLGLIRRLCDRVLVMYGGSIVEDSPASEFFGRAHHPYSRALQAATPRLGAQRGEIRPIPGQPVDLAHLPAGCAFAPRCDRRTDRCDTEVPVLVPVPGSAARVACWHPIDGNDASVDVTSVVGADATAVDGDGPSETLVAVRDATRVYKVRAAGGLLHRRRDLVALGGVSIEIAPGRTLALVGESGSGKSTLAHAVLGLTPLTSGRIELSGEDARTGGDRARREQWMQAVFQDPHGSLNPHLMVNDVVAEPLVNLGVGRAEREARVREVLDAVRLPPSLARHRPRELSGGQAQRVAIARALAPRPKVIVLDEPTASLDVSIQTHIVSLLRELQAEHSLTYLFVSHDLAGVREIASDVAVMYLGRLVEVAPWRALFDSPQHPYTVALLSAVPSIDEEPDTDQRIVLNGEPPSALAVPPGCAFHTRCPVAQDRCATDVPVLSPVTTGGMVACHFPGSLAVAEAPIRRKPDVPVALTPPTRTEN